MLKSISKQMSRLIRKQTSCICKNKGADQLRGYREADQRHCFRYMDSIIPLILISKISSFWPFSVTVQAGEPFVSDLFENHIVGFPIAGLL